MSQTVVIYITLSTTVFHAPSKMAQEATIKVFNHMKHYNQQQLKDERVYLDYTSTSPKRFIIKEIQDSNWNWKGTWRQEVI